MYNKIANYIAREMLKHSVIDKEKLDIYVYGFELMIAYFFYIIGLLIVAIASKTTFESVAFCVGFALVRKYSGGYHACNYLRCQFLFILNQLMFVIAIKLIPLPIYKYLILFMILTYVIFIWVFAPVDNINKRFNSNEYVYFKNASRICSIIIAVSSVMIWCFLDIPVLLLSFLVGVYSATISVVVGYLIQRKNNKGVNI